MIVTCAVAIFSAGLPTTVALIEADRQQRAHQFERLDRGIDVVQSWIERQLDRNSSVAAEIAARRNVEAAIRFRSAPELRRTLVGLKERTRVDFIAFLDEFGAVIERDSSLFELPESAAVSQAALGGRSAASVVTTPLGLVMVAAAPVESEGKTVGVVIVADEVDTRFVGQIRRITGLETAFVGSGVAIGSLPEWTGPTLQLLVDDRARLLLTTRGRLVEDRVVANVSYRVAMAPLLDIGGRPTASIVLAMPIASGAGGWFDTMRLVWPWLALVPLWILTGLWLRRIDPTRSPPATLEPPRRTPTLTPTPPAPRLTAATLADSRVPARLDVTPDALTGNAKADTTPLNGPAAPALRDPAEWAQVGDIIVDLAAHEVWFAGKPVSLTRTEFALLWRLASNVGRTQTRDDLINAVWGEDQMAEPAMVDAHIGNLRKKVEPSPSRPAYIVTVRGVGYKMVVPEANHVSA